MLPKWLKVIISGKSVSESEAKEIIFKTDKFLVDPCRLAGDMMTPEFNDSYRRKAGLNLIVDNEGMTDWDKLEKLERNLKILKLHHFNNMWASSCSIDGPEGWCHPDGIIGLSTYIKYPCVDEILKEWNDIAGEFKFLRLNATLLNEEETEALVNVAVSYGSVSCWKPEDPENYLAKFHNSTLPQECFGKQLPYEWYDDYAERVKSAIIGAL